MRVFSVLLEGIEESQGYFMNIAVASDVPEQALKLARQKPRELRLEIQGVEEIVRTNETSPVETPQVLSTSGKSYFPSQE